MKLGEVSQYLWGICDEYFQEVGSKTKYLANVANVARTSLSMWLSTEYLKGNQSVPIKQRRSLVGRSSLQH
jgi:hypothetical protein